MKKLSHLLSVLLLLFFISGCTSLKRFKSVSYQNQDNSLVNIELFGSHLGRDGLEPISRNLWDLSASAQPQMIQILNERFPLNREFMNALNNEYLLEHQDRHLDFTESALRMIFTISKQRDYASINDASERFSPADRIEYIKISLEIPDEYNLRFKQWNRYVTEYGEIEIGDVSFSRSLDLDMDGSIGENTEPGGKGSFNRNEEQKIRSRYLKLNGSMNDHMILIEEEGNREIDLTGNILTDITLKFEGFPERISRPVFIEDGQGSGELTVAGLRFENVLVPRMGEAPDSIRASMKFNYIYRHVQSGWKTYPEWDDRVEYYSGDVEREIVLFTKADYLPGFYGIGIDLPEKNEIKVRAADGVDYPLHFINDSDAGRFLMWLLGQPKNQVPVTIGKNTLIFNGGSLTGAMSNQLDLKVMPVY